LQVSCQTRNPALAAQPIAQLLCLHKPQAADVVSVGDELADLNQEWWFSATAAR
jgi:hypothetical protein